MCRPVKGHVSTYECHVPPMCPPVESAHETKAMGFNTVVYVLTCSKDVSTYSLENFTIGGHVYVCVSLSYACVDLINDFS